MEISTGNAPMLAIEHVTKVYRTKGGTDTRALDDVTVSFDETGLVFLLGKSGSGKSTLLNVAGGLDEPTEGEVIVMGKSSRSFTGSDFDSYRNTFVGFVFQEYNVLNEFNVEDNIALALELQGKPKDKEKIAEILRQVELEAYAKRKPNTLSGGQKQRIAIARALVKDPQIIMADEPTGALDSATGKQVFDTLKELSKTRLVIVVSHDREFAEIYGDRIIELRDGQIISDVSKVKVAAREAGNILHIGEDTISVRGSDEATLRAVAEFLRGSKGEVVLTRGAQDVAAFRRAARIDESGAREAFETTPPVPSHDYGETKFIRSRLPAGKAIKIGAAGLKLKPFRLVMTIFLSCVAFIMFGLFSTMMLYDGKSVLTETYMNSGDSYISLTKRYETYSYYEDEFRYTMYDETEFTPKDVASFGEGAFGAYGIGSANIQNVDDGTSRYYSPSIYKVACLPEGHPLREALGDKYPQGPNEIAVSSYLLDCIKNGEFHTVDPENQQESVALEIKSEEDLIGQYLSIFYLPFKVTGVFDSGAVPSRFDSLKEEDDSFLGTMNQYSYQSGYLPSSLHGVAFISDAAVEALSDYFQISYYDRTTHFNSMNVGFSAYLTDREGNDGPSVQYGSARAYDANAKDVLPVLFFGEERPLQGNEVILDGDSLYYNIDFIISQNMPESGVYEEPIRENFSSDEEYQQAVEAWNYMQESEQVRWAVNMLFTGGTFYDPETETDRFPTEAEKTAAMQTIKEFFTAHPIAASLTRYDFSLGEVSVAGVYFTSNHGDGGFYCSQEFYDEQCAPYATPQWREETKYVHEDDAVFASVFLPLTRNSMEFRNFLQKCETIDPDTAVFYQLMGDLYDSVSVVNSMVEMLSTIFLWVGVVMAVFASLLLFNFITMSISNKQKEIGILRAVGARGLDVFKIFFSESGIIVGICVIISLIGTALLATFINGVLRADAGLAVTLFVFGPLPILLMLGVALAVALIATFLPVYFASRKKPVESIRAL